jgi:peptide/nickel transport system permease protein
VLKLLRDRLLDFVPALVLASLAIFGLLYLLPGDPATAMLANSGAPAELVEGLRVQFGLDQPPHVQYWRFVSQAATGDFGRSLASRRPVVAMLAEVAPRTLELAAAGVAVAVVLGVPLGMLAAAYRRTWLDRAAMVVATVGVSMPPFWLALLALFWFSFRLGWVPATGVGGWQRLVLPALVLGAGAASAVARMVRSAVLEALGQDYVVAARGKGLTEWRVLTRHALRNALIPVVTVIGLQAGWLLGGTVIVETVFSRPGLGRLLVQAIINQDFPVVQGAVVALTAVYLVLNLALDVLYGLLDPRIRM